MKNRKTLGQRISDSQPVRAIRRNVAEVIQLGSTEFLDAAGVDPEVVRKLTGSKPGKEDRTF